MAFEHINLGVGIVAAVVAIAGLGYAIIQDYPAKLFSKKDRVIN